MHAIFHHSANTVDPAVSVTRPVFPELYDDHIALVWRALRRLGVAEASLEDAAQEVFVVAHRKLASFEGKSSVSTWLYGISVMVARNFRRSVRRHAEAPLEPRHEEALTSAPPDEAAESGQASRIVERLLESLSEEKREVFVLAELEELSGPEIATTLGLNLNTVYARLRAARQAFDEAALRFRKAQQQLRRAR